MPPRRGSYGIDAPYVLWMLALATVGFLAVAMLLAALAERALALVFLYWSLWMLGSSLIYFYTTRRGKFVVWWKLLAELGLRGDERVLDLGCGRGAVLLMAAELLPRGRAVGVDLWSTSDQSGNALQEAQRNAALEGVADRVELHTGDMRSLPFDDAAFDVVLSSLAIHNLKSRADRQQAIDQAARVLKPHGRLLIADFRGTRDYATRLRQLGLADVRERYLGPRFWYGGPWTATRLVSATKPSV